jgi:transcriptional regulator with XRE-family HTH domain
MKLNTFLTDAAVMAELGARLGRVRLLANLTQADVATRAGVGKRTVERLEMGEAVQLESFLRVCRVLGLLEALDQAIAPPEPGPYDLLQMRGRVRRRARPRGDAVAEVPPPYGATTNADSATNHDDAPAVRPPRKPFVWGEDK